MDGEAAVLAVESGRFSFRSVAEPGSADAQGRSPRAGALTSTLPENRDHRHTEPPRHLHAERRTSGRGREHQRAGTAAVRRLADRPRGPRDLSQWLHGRVHPLLARGAAADRQDRMPAGSGPGAGAGGRRPRRTSTRRSPPARPMRATAPGRGHCLAVLLQAQPRVGLRLLPRDRPAQPDRRE